MGGAAGDRGWEESGPGDVNRQPEGVLNEVLEHSSIEEDESSVPWRRAAS